MNIEDIAAGKQFMIRRFEDSRRVRVEIEKIETWGTSTVFVFGRTIKRFRGDGMSKIVGPRRSWSTRAEFIEEVEQI